MYSEDIIQATLSDEVAGIKVCGLNINNVRFADDTALLAENLEDLQLLYDRISERSKEIGLSFNVNKKVHDDI